MDTSDQRIGQRIGQEYLGAAPRVAAQAGVDRQLTRLDTFKVGAEVRRKQSALFSYASLKGACYQAVVCTACVCVTLVLCVAFH